jgi:hypothetical protein
VLATIYKKPQILREFTYRGEKGGENRKEGLKKGKF